MRDVKSTQRRRRLRVIKAVEERWAKRRHSAVSALAIASGTEAVRVDVDEIRRHLFAECRAKSSTRLRVEHPGAAPMSVVMDRPYLLIGSEPACDLSLDHEDIQPRHCYLQWIDGHVFCCDIGPRLDFFPDRRQQSNGRWLDRQPISIGPYQLSIDDDQLPAPPNDSPLDRSPRLATEYPQLGLQFEGVEQSDKQWPVNRVLTMIGRGSQCKLRLNHPSISHVQACLLRTPQGCWLIDLAGAGTTGVNDRAITIAPIDIGDRLQLGPFMIEVVTMEFAQFEVPIAAKINRATANRISPIAFDHPPKIDPHPTSDSSIGFPSNDTQDQSIVRLSPPLISETPAKPEGAANIRNAHQESNSMLSVTAIQHPEKTDANATEESIAHFIQQQRSQLAILKTRLDKLKEIYDSAAGQLISKRMRDMLEKPVIETMQSHDSMQESLDLLVRNVEHQPL